MVHTSDIEEEQAPNVAEGCAAGGLVGVETAAEGVNRPEGERAEMGAVFEQVTKAELRRILTTEIRVEKKVEQEDDNSTEEKGALEPAVPSEQEKPYGEDAEPVDPGNLPELLLGELNKSHLGAIGTKTDSDKAILRLEKNDPFILEIE